VGSRTVGETVRGGAEREETGGCVKLYSVVRVINLLKPEFYI